MSKYGSGKCELGGSDRIILKDEYGLVIYGRRWIEGDYPPEFEVHVFQPIWVETLIAFLRIHFPDSATVQSPITDEKLAAISYEFVLRFDDIREMEEMQSQFERSGK